MARAAERVRGRAPAPGRPAGRMDAGAAFFGAGAAFVTRPRPLTNPQGFRFPETEATDSRGFSSPPSTLSRVTVPHPRIGKIARIRFSAARGLRRNLGLNNGGGAMSADFEDGSGMVAGAAALLGLTAAAQAQTLASLPTEAGARVQGDASSLAAGETFCQAYAAECTVHRSEPRTSLTPATWTTIASVNRRVNKAVEPMTDQEHLHVADRWDLADVGIGDCEDFQLLKRHLLAEAGLPRLATRMTVVIDEKGERHAVLTLITDRGDLVLDNKISAILPAHRTGYVFIKRESQDAVAWVSLGGVTSPVTTANR